MKILAVIPARYASTRFPGKPLVHINGKTMIQRVYEQVRKVKEIKKIVVATDDERIYGHVRTFGECMMTSSKHKNGTERSAEVAKKFSGYDIVINIQGDEPFISPQQIQRVIKIFKQNKKAEIGTLVKPNNNADELSNPNLIKVVLDKNKRALYFSRAMLPFDAKRNSIAPNYFKHIGIYAYRRKTLLEIAKLKPSQLELTESLEQLRWMENGYAVHAELTNEESFSIDVPEDLGNVKN